MNAPAMMADHLDAQADAIIAVWRATVDRLGDVPEAEKLSDSEFIDHIPELLDRLAERLRGRPTDALVEGHKHGLLRWRQGYDAAELITELGHLRTALIRATFGYAREHDFDVAALEAVWSVVNEVLNEATAEAVGHFEELNESRMGAALAEVQQRQRAVEEAKVAAEAERAKLRTILAHLPVGVWVCNASGLVVGINREAEHLLGIPEAQAVGRVDVRRLGTEYPLSRLDGSAFGPDETPMARALRGDVVTQEEVGWPDGDTSRTVSINAAPLHDVGGAIQGAVAVTQDITPRKEAEERLRRQLDFTRVITDNMGEGLYAVDREGRLTFMNRAAERSFGWAEAELLGRIIHEAVHYQHADGSPFPADECPLLEAARSGATVRGEEVFTSRDGRIFPADYTSSPIITGGRVVGAVLSFHDITERKRLEEDLAASEARFRGIAEQSPVMIWRAQPDGRCDYFNQTWYDFRGRTPEQELGDGWIEGIHPDDRELCRTTYLGAVARRVPYEMTCRMLRRDGQYRWIAARGTPYQDGQGAFLGYLGSCLDITERIELEKALEQQRELAEQASSHKTRLLAALSHDARTPLNAVVLAAQLLEMHCQGMGNAEVDECLRTIRHSVGNVLELLGDLLNLTRIDAGATPAEVARFALEPILAESLSSIEPQARVKGLDVRLEPDGLAGAVLETDRSKLKQLLCNLLSNSLRYTERGHIRIHGARADDQIRIAVEDTGVGIAPEDQHRIFDEFATLSKPHRPAGEGTGLGLAICRRLANLLHGEITLSSAPGRGSTFTLVLPVSVLVEGPSDGPPGVAEPESPRSGVILVAEDHLTSRQTLAKVLRRMGYRALEAGNGRDALALARRERPLAILMDVNMPVMDGIEATLALRADPATRHLPIFALTGDVSVINQRRIGEAGVDGYLEKPVTWEVLKQALASIDGRP